jgi:hypothetical protein
VDDPELEWKRKGATLSDKTARKEFDLTQAEIVGTIQSGKLQCRRGSMHGNPWFRLLRREVEAWVKAKNGSRYLTDKLVQTELRQIDTALRRLKTQIVALEKRKLQLVKASSGGGKVSAGRTR